MRTLLVCATLLAAGCANTSAVSVASAGGSTMTTTGGYASIQVAGSGNPAVGNAIMLMGLVAVGVESWRMEQQQPVDRKLTLDPNRSINVQDCTQPIRDLTANLRCR